MAATVGPLPLVKLPSGPSQITAEQRYWKSFKNQLQLPSPTGYAITSISPPSHDAFAVTTGTRVQVYSIRTRKLEKTITRFSDIARSGYLRRDGKVLVAGEDTGRIQVFDVNSRAILKTWMVHKQPVWTTKFSPVELTTLLSASDDKTVRLWDLTNNDPTSTLVGHADYVRCAEFMPGSGAAARTIVSGSYDSTVKLWDPRVASSSGAVLTFKHAAPIEAVLPLASGTTLLASASNAISVLDLVAARPVHQITNHQKTVTSLALASNGTRVLSGALDGHVKVFETTGWNVVSSTKYPSPIHALRVITTTPAGSLSSSSSSSSTDAGTDRHLAVGMESGVLNLRTRITGQEALRQREREREMAALVAGTIGRLDAAKSRKRRHEETAKRLDSLGDDVDMVIAADGKRKGGTERQWHRDMRQGRFSAALDRVLDPQAKDYSPLDVLTCFVALRHRSAMREALDGRDERTVLPLLKYLCRYIIDPRYVSICVEVAVHLIEMYSEYAPASAELWDAFRTLRRRVVVEVERAQVACETEGMVESLMLGAS